MQQLSVTLIVYGVLFDYHLSVLIV